MSSVDPAAGRETEPLKGANAPEDPASAAKNEQRPAKVGTVVWGLVVLAIAALIIIAQLGLVALNGTYVAIGLLMGAGLALVVGGLLSARRRDKEAATGKS
jgi:choline-glycine betaine transporter